MSNNSSTNDNFEFFFVSDLKIVYCNNYHFFDHNALHNRGKNILPHYSLGEKTIQNYLKIEATYLYDNDVFLRQETKKKRLHVLDAYVITIRKHLFDISSTKNGFFTAIISSDRQHACLSNKSLSY